MRGLRAFGLVFVFSTFIPFALGYTFEQNLTAQGMNGAVSCENKVCSQAGASMLKRGGNAADAMVATVLCVGVTGMYNSGISGGGFALIRMPNNTYDMVDFREQAPGSASETMFVNDKNASQVGGRAIAVPGQLRGLDHILKRYGKLDWQTVIEPAIEVAEYGFIFGHDMEWMVNWTLKNAPLLNASQPNLFVQDPAWQPDFAPNGKPLKQGAIMTRKRYAEALRNISKNGAEDFYTGSTARTMLQAIRKHGGNMTEKDLRSYSIVHRRTREIEYRNYTLTSTVAPSSGSVLLNILGVLNNYDNFFTNTSTRGLDTHRMVEAIKFGYAYRNSFGDPAFTPNISTLESTMLSQARIQRIWHNIDDNSVHKNVSFYDPDHKWTPESFGTSHMVTADADGLVFSLTTTTNLPFGSHVMVPETGIVLNSQMDDFSTPNTTNAFGYPANPNNFIKPGKRPLSSISPVIACRVDGSFAFATGAAGGSHIPTTTLQTLIHALDESLSPSLALDRPRLHHQLFPNYVEIPGTYNNATVEILRKRGHIIRRMDEWSYAQAIFRSEGGQFIAAAEPRQHESGAVAV